MSKKQEGMIQVALAGNPNCGKTVIFNALTGASQRVGNWPGVTVDKKEGEYYSSTKNIIKINIKSFEEVPIHHTKIKHKTEIM